MPFRLPFASRSPSQQQPAAGGGSPAGSSSTVPLPPVSPTKATTTTTATLTPNPSSTVQASLSDEDGIEHDSALSSSPAPEHPAQHEGQLAQGLPDGSAANKLSLDLLPPYAQPSLSALSSPSSLLLASNTRSSSTGSQLSSDSAVGESSSSAATSAATSVSSLHASDDERAALGQGTWRSELAYLESNGKQDDRRKTTAGRSTVTAVGHQQQQSATDDGASVTTALEEETPRGERPPILSLPSGNGGGAMVDQVQGVSSSKDEAGSPSPSYFPYSPDERVSPHSEVPPPTVTDCARPTAPAVASMPPPSSVSATDRQFGPPSKAPPPSAYRSPSYPPPSRPHLSAGSGPAVVGAGITTRSHTHHASPSVSTTSTGQSSLGGSESWRSSVFSSASSSSASSYSTSSSSSCSVSTPVLPRPWLASDQLLGKTPMTDIRDEDALMVETTDDNYVVVACLPGFSLDCITLATKSRRTLHIVADRWERENSAHFERKVTFGNDADLSKIRAQFDGSMLRVTVLRRPELAAGSSGQSFTSFGSGSSVLNQHRASAPAAHRTTSPWGTGSDSWAPARPASTTRSSAPGLLDAAGHEISAIDSSDGSGMSTVRARSPDAAMRVLAQAGGDEIDELLARAKGRDGGQYI